MISILGSIIVFVIIAVFGIVVYVAEQSKMNIPRMVYWFFYFFALADIVVQLATKVADYIMK